MCAETYTYESQPSSPHIKVFNPLYKLKDAGKDKKRFLVPARLMCHQQSLPAGFYWLRLH
jgi:hypothetical protein